MENSSSAHAAWLSLALTAIVGASVAAASSYLIHCRTFDRLQSQKLLDNGDQQKRRSDPRKRTNRDSVDGSNATAVAPELLETDTVKSVLNSFLPPRLLKLEFTESITTIPPGLTRVHTRKEGGAQQSPGSVRRQQPSAMKLAQPSSPTSPERTGSYESVEGSEEEDHLLPSEEDNYNDDDDNEDDDHKNGIPADGERNGGSEMVDRPVIPQSPQSVENNGAGKPTEKSASNLIRSHSISADLHSIHGPDPVAADILRKEPEQETYVKLNVSPLDECSSHACRIP